MKHLSQAQVQPKYEPGNVLESKHSSFGRVVSVSAKVEWEGRGIKSIHIDYYMKDGGSYFSLPEEHVIRLVSEK